MVSKAKTLSNSTIGVMRQFDSFRKDSKYSQFVLLKYNCFPNLTVNASLNRDLLYQQNIICNVYKKETRRNT